MLRFIAQKPKGVTASFWPNDGHDALGRGALRPSHSTDCLRWSNRAEARTGAALHLTNRQSRGSVCDMSLRLIARVSVSYSLLHLLHLHLLHHAVALAQPAESTQAPASTLAPTQGTAGERAEAEPAAEPQASEATVPTGAGASSNAPPTAQFETVTSAPEVHASPPAAPNAASGAAPDAAFALGAKVATDSPAAATAAAPSQTAQPSEAVSNQTSITDAFADARAATDAANNWEPSEFRQRQMPGDYVARPLTLPEGTFELTLNNHVAFVDAAEVVGWVPSFAFGVTSEFELGMSAPLRYNESLRDWTKLDPLVHVAQQWWDTPELEAAARLAVLIPLTSKSDVQIEVGVPFLWHATSSLRVDAAVNGVIALEDPTQAAVNVPLGVTLQAASWLFTGLSATPNVGLTSQRKFGVDAAARLGLTLQARGSAQVDLMATLFAENIGTGRDGQTTDGIGTTFTAAFYPDTY